MVMLRVINQLEFLKKHCQCYVDEADPEDIWKDDVEALTIAIDVLKQVRNEEENAEHDSKGS